MDAQDQQYQINEIFYSLQGEGVRAGTPAVFLRFSGCNLTCSVESHGFDCDTEFVSGRKMTAQQIVEEVKSLADGCRWVIFTGGEPLLQLDEPLAACLKESGFSLAIETNGSIALSEKLLALLDWVTCSPKVAEHAVRLQRCDELKYVRAAGQGIPKPKLRDTVHKLISPAFSGDQLDPKTLDWCIDLVKTHPDWRLSVQQHKTWHIR